MIIIVRAWFWRVFPGVCPKAIQTRRGVLIIYGKGLVRQRAMVAQPSAVFPRHASILTLGSSLAHLGKDPTPRRNAIAG
jgi:hypothetical protein